MARTQIDTEGILSVQRNDFDITTTGQAVITKVIAGTNVTISSTGIDAGTGDVTINCTASGGAATPYAETPTGLLNGSNVTFTLANTPTNAQGVLVYLDGVFQYYGIDFTVSGNTITFVTAPSASTATIFAVYGVVSGAPGSGVTTLAAVGSAPNANAATISGSTLTLQPASLTQPGVTIVGAQTFGGLKTFDGGVKSSTLTGNGGTLTISTPLQDNPNGITVSAGSAINSGNGGGIQIEGGAGGAVDGLGGSVTIRGGSSFDGASAGGDVTLQVGSGTGNGVFKFLKATGGLGGILNFDAVATANKTYSFPNATGTVVLHDAAQTLSNKETINLLNYGAIAHETQGTTPANPAAGFVKIYAKTDGNIYKLTSAGVESAVGGGGGDMVLASTQTVTGAKTFNNNTLILAGLTSGTTTLTANAVAGAGTVILPLTGTLVTLAGSEILTNKDLTGAGNAFPTLNQNTTGSAASLTTPRSISMSGDVSWTVNFNGTGNVTAVGTIQAGVVTPANMANVATGTIFYRKTAGAGSPEVQTLATLKTDLAITKADVGLSNVDNTSDAQYNVATATLTNKRIDPRVAVTNTIVNATPDVSTTDQYIITAQQQNLTFNAPTGTPVQGTKLMLRITDNGTARTITWDAIFRAIGVTLPTTTTILKTIYIGCVYNATDLKWDVIAVGIEA